MKFSRLFLLFKSQIYCRTYFFHVNLRSLVPRLPANIKTSFCSGLVFNVCARFSYQSLSYNTHFLFFLQLIILSASCFRRWLQRLHNGPSCVAVKVQPTALCGRSLMYWLRSVLDRTCKSFNDPLVYALSLRCCSNYKVFMQART